MHPSVEIAIKYIGEYTLNELKLTLEALSTVSKDGSRTAKVNAESLRKYLNNESMEDTYTMGLALLLKDMERKK